MWRMETECDAVGRAPMRARGLKHIYVVDASDVAQSRPYAGAWIETLFVCGFRLSLKSRPYAGAWIETC